MPFPAAKATTTPAVHVLAVGLKVYVKDPDLAQQYPADVIKVATPAEGDLVTVALYQGKDMKRPALATNDIMVDVPRAAAFFTPIIGLTVVGYGAEETVPATAPVTTPAAAADGKPVFNDVATFIIPGWTGMGRGGAELLTVNGRTARKVLTFEGQDTGLVAEASAAFMTASLDKAYCDRVVSMVQFWREQVAKGVHPDIGLELPGQQTINTGANTETAADATKRRGRRTNAEIAAAKAVEAQQVTGAQVAGTPAAGALAPTSTTPAAQAQAVPGPTETALIVQRALWTALKATAEAELAKITAY